MGCPSGLVLWISPPPSYPLQFVMHAFSEVTGETSALLKFDMDCFCQGSEKDLQYILCRVPVSPSLRKLYRMFQLAVVYSLRDGEDEEDEDPSDLVEIELFGDYIGGIPLDVMLESHRPLLHFQECYANYASGKHVVRLMEMSADI